MGKLQLPKNGFKLKLRKENNDPLRIAERSESQPNNRLDSDNASIFNVTFGNFKFTPKQQSNNNPLFWKGKNFNSEGILPPNFQLEDVFLKYEGDKKKGVSPAAILNKNVNYDTKCSRNKNNVYVRYFHTSDGARKHSNASLGPYRDSQPYLHQNEDINTQNNFKLYRSNLEGSTLSSEVRWRSNPEEDSPFFIKRRIRSSNPHARVKRKAHPMISKHFFKKQMSRHGNRSKLLIQEEGESSAEKSSKWIRLKNISNTASKPKEKKISKNIYLCDSKMSHDAFSNYWYIQDSLQPKTKNFI